MSVTITSHTTGLSRTIVLATSYRDLFCLCNIGIIIIVNIIIIIIEKIIVLIHEKRCRCTINSYGRSIGGRLSDSGMIITHATSHWKLELQQEHLKCPLICSRVDLHCYVVL